METYKYKYLTINITKFTKTLVLFSFKIYILYSQVVVALASSILNNSAWVEINFFFAHQYFSKFSNIHFFYINLKFFQHIYKYIGDDSDNDESKLTQNTYIIPQIVKWNLPNDVIIIINLVFRMYKIIVRMFLFLKCH